MRSQPALRSLLQPVRPLVVMRALGQLSLVLAALLLVPLLVAISLEDWSFAAMLAGAALAPALLLGVLGAALPARDGALQSGEAMVVMALTFVLAALFMTPSLASAGMSLADAWFEAVSGVTTTGLSLLSQPEMQRPAVLFARSWMQWFGGLGIVVFSMTLSFIRVEELRRFAETLGDAAESGEGLRAHARRLVVVYLLLTLAAILLVWVAGLPLFEALLHALAAISTGGFAVRSDSLASLAEPTRWAILAVALLGALPLGLWLRAWHQGAGALGSDLELRALLLAVLVVALLLWSLGGLGLDDAFWQAGFAQTTTGFSTLDLAALDPSAKGLLIVSMLIGGGAGSTAGGIKLLRLLILIQVIRFALLRARLPRHAVAQPWLGAHALAPAQIEHALLLILLYLMVVLASWWCFLVAGEDALDALFEVVSATATVGLSSGLSTPDLGLGLKLLLTLDMLLGRVEILALWLVLLPRTWMAARD